MDTLALTINGQPATETPVIVTEWQDVEFACVPPTGHTLALAVSSDAALPDFPLQPFLRPGDPSWYWQWNPRNLTGRVALVLRITTPDGAVTTQQTTLLEVVPRKLDQEQYRLLLDDVQHTLGGVLYALAASTAGAAMRPPSTLTEQTRRYQHPLEAYAAFFARRFPMFEQAVWRIARAPYTRTVHGTRPVALGQAHDLSYVGKGGDLSHAAETTSPPLPAAVRHPYTSESSDTYENRLLKRVLVELRRRVRLVDEPFSAVSANRAADTAMATVAGEVRAIVQRIERLLALPFLSTVAPLSMFHGPTHMIRRHQDYRRVYRLWQDLRRLPAFALDSDWLRLPIRHLPRLYEYWCVVQMLRAVLDLPGASVEDYDLLERSESEGVGKAAMVEDRPLLVLSWGEVRLVLRYQPRYRPLGVSCALPVLARPHSPENLGSLDDSTHIPDIALELWGEGLSPVLLVVEAKYRLTASGQVPEDARADAYTYLGSIGTATGYHAVRQVAICYPGHPPAISYASGVSLLPLLPGGADSLATWLSAALA